MNKMRDILTLLLLHAALWMAAAEPRDTVALNGVTVTAIKQSASGTAPSSVTTIGSEQINRLHIESVKGAADVVPNLFIPDYGSRITSSIYVRGIGARIDQPAVGLTVDNVPFLNKDAYDFDIADIACMKVIRGPQSTLFGRNTMAGIIDITTISPIYFQGLRAMAQYGKANTWKVDAGYYCLATHDLGFAATVRAGGSDGFFTNTYSGSKCDHEKSVTSRIKADWRPSSALSIVNTFALSWLKQGGYPYENVDSGIIAYNDTCSYRRLCINDGLTVRWQLGSLSISSISSWQYIDDDMHLDQDFMPLPYFTLIQAKHENAFTQDIVVKTNFSPLYSALFGIFGFYKHLDMNAPVTFKDTGISELIEKNRNHANDIFPIRWTERSFVLNSHFVNPTYGLAAYHNSDFSLGAFKVSAALRLDFEHTALSYHSFTSTQYEILQLNQDNDTYSHYRYVPVDIDEQGNLHHSFLQLLPRLSAEYSFSTHYASAIISASVAKGYKSGGFNTQMFSDVLQQHLMWQMGIGMLYDVDDIVSYKPEKSWNYELGAHISFPRINLTADATIFYIDVRDQQLTMFPDGTTTGRIMTNAGRTASYGFELSGSWQPLDVLQFNLAYGHTTARFRDFFNGRKQFRGNAIPYAPANTLFAACNYIVSIGKSQALSFNLNLRANGKIYWNEDNSLSQPFYALLGASSTYHHPKFSVELWANNITNTRFHTFYFVSIGHEFVQRGRPFDCGITLRAYLTI